MFIVIVRYPVSEVINFEIYLNFSTSSRAHLFAIRGRPNIGPGVL